MTDLGHLIPRHEKRKQWVEDQLTGEMFEVDADAAVFDLSDAAPVKSGETLTFSWTQNLMA